MISKTLVLGLFGLAYAGDLQFIKWKIADGCGPALEQAAVGLWVEAGDNQDQLVFTTHCSDLNAKKCAIRCADGGNVIFDRQKTGTTIYDVQMMASRHKYFLLRCRCQMMQSVITREYSYAGCRWTWKRFWSEKDYRDERNMARKTAMEGDSDDDTTTRRKRSSSVAQAKLYCLNQMTNAQVLALHLKDTPRRWKDPRGFDSCGLMEEIFTATGGEWKCRRDKNNHDVGSECLFKHTCHLHCPNSDNPNTKARFTCYRPWIARPNTKWETRAPWRRFKGSGPRIYRTGLLNCALLN
jgi:hypothetical protein